MSKSELHFRKKQWHFQGLEAKMDDGIRRVLHFSSDKNCHKGDNALHTVNSQ